MPPKKPINLSIRDLSSKKDPTKLKCLIDPDPVINFDESIKYLHKGVKYFLNVNTFFYIYSIYVNIYCHHL